MPLTCFILLPLFISIAFFRNLVLEPAVSLHVFFHASRQSSRPLFFSSCAFEMGEPFRAPRGFLAKLAQESLTSPSTVEWVLNFDAPVTPLHHTARIARDLFSFHLFPL